MSANFTDMARYLIDKRTISLRLCFSNKLYQRHEFCFNCSETEWFPYYTLFEYIYLRSRWYEN